MNARLISRRGKLTLAAVALAAGCSSSGATADADAGAAHDGRVIDLGQTPVDVAGDAGAEAVPRFSEDVDGTPCPSGVACPSGLCGVGGLCLPSYRWSRTLPDDACAQWVVAAPDGDLLLLGVSPVTGFIEKVDPELNVRWRHTFNVSSQPAAYLPSPAVLPDGTIVVAVNGTRIALDTGDVLVATTADNHAAVFALSSAGAYRWIKTFPPPFDFSDQIGITGVSGAPGGGFTLAGTYRGKVNFDFDGTAATTGAAGMPTTAYVARYDAGAKLSWVRSFPSSAGVTIGEDSVGGFMGVAPDGSTFIAGSFAGTGAFGTNQGTSLNFGTEYVAHLDPLGSLTGPGAWLSNPPGLPRWALAPDGAFYGVQSYDRQSPMEFKRVDPTTGQPLWSFPITFQLTYRILAGTDMVLLSGDFSAPTDFDLGPRQVLYQPRGPTNSPYFTGFLASYDTSGNLRWVREPTVITTVQAIGRDGSIYALANVPSELTDFDPGPAVDAMLPRFEQGCYIVKYGP